MIKIVKLGGIFLLVVGVLIPLYSFVIPRIEEDKYQEILVQSMEEENYYGVLEIEKIHFKREIFPIDHKNNQVNKNVFLHSNSVLPGDETSHIILAAHSGNGRNAFFKDLYLLEIHDEICFYYQGKKWIYEIVDIEYQKKTGVLYLKEDYANMITLITCTKGDDKTQTIYYGSLKTWENL